jgi:CAAX protease family protein
MTTTSGRSAAGGTRILAGHPLVAFFVLAYLLSWLVWSPWVLGEDGAGWLPTRVAPSMVGYLNAAAIFLGPAVAGIVMTAVTEGGPGVRALLGRVVRGRVDVGWWAVALVGVPLLAVLGATIYTGLLPDVAALGVPSFLLSYVPSFLLIAVLGGPLFEEIGWRGFALPRLQRIMHPAVASVALGLLWCFWHAPQFLSPTWAASSGGGGPVGILLYALTVVSFSIIITWIFNHTRASILIAVLVHTSIDAVSTVLPELYPPDVAQSALPLVIAYGGTAVVLLAATRGRLGIRSLHAQDLGTGPARDVAPDAPAVG